MIGCACKGMARIAGRFCRREPLAAAVVSALGCGVERSEAFASVERASPYVVKHLLARGRGNEDDASRHMSPPPCPQARAGHEPRSVRRSGWAVDVACRWRVPRSRGGRLVSALLDLARLGHLPDVPDAW